MSNNKNISMIEKNGRLNGELDSVICWKPHSKGEFFLLWFWLIGITNMYRSIFIIRETVIAVNIIIRNFIIFFFLI